MPVLAFNGGMKGDIAIGARACFTFFTIVRICPSLGSFHRFSCGAEHPHYIATDQSGHVTAFYNARKP